MPRKRLYKPQSRKTKQSKTSRLDEKKISSLDEPAPRQKVGGFTHRELELLDLLVKKTGYKSRSAYMHDVSLGYKPPNNAITLQTDDIVLKLNEVLTLAKEIKKSLNGIDNNINQITKHANIHRALRHEDIPDLAQALSSIPDVKDAIPKIIEDVVLAAHAIVSMTCPTIEE